MYKTNPNHTFASAVPFASAQPTEDWQSLGSATNRVIDRVQLTAPTSAADRTVWWLNEKHGDTVVAETNWGVQR
ncbi:MAG: hypothetical protein ACR2PG_20405 [Hyphomicrobiaceae bacterium]